jgi:hypothetical protein
MRISGYPDLRSAAGKERVGVSLGEHTGDELYLIFIPILLFHIIKLKDIYILFPKDYGYV